MDGFSGRLDKNSFWFESERKLQKGEGKTISIIDQGFCTLFAQRNS